MPKSRWLTAYALRVLAGAAGRVGWARRCGQVAAVQLALAVIGGFVTASRGGAARCMATHVVDSRTLAFEETFWADHRGSRRGCGAQLAGR